MRKFFTVLMTIFAVILLFGCDSNSMLIRKFDREFEQFKSKASRNNQLVFDMNVEVKLYEKSVYLGKESVAATIKMNESPLYIDISMGDGIYKESTLFTQKGNNIYEHQIVDENLVVTEYYSSVDDYENSSYDAFNEFDFDSDYGTVEKQDDYYVFTLKLDETLTDEDKEYLEDLYEILNLSLEHILDSEIIIKYKFNKNSLYMSVDLASDMNVNGKDIQVNGKVEYDIRIEDFELIDISSYEHVASTIDSVYDYSKLDEFTNRIDIGKRYYKYKLEKGYYYIDRIDDFNDFEFELFNSEKQKISTEYLFYHFNNNTKDGTIFEIKESGDYYIKIDRSHSRFALKKYSIDDYKASHFVLNTPNKIALKNNQFSYIEMESKLPFVCIQNTGKTEIKIEKIYDGQTYFIRPNEKRYIETHDDVISLLITNVGTSEECSFTMEEIDKSGDPNTPYDELEIMTDSPSKGFYYCDMNMYSHSLMKMVVEEEGYYTFYNTRDEISAQMNFFVNSMNGGYAAWTGDNEWLLFPGEYLITLQSVSSLQEAYGNVYYEFKSLDFDYEHEIPVNYGKEPTSDDFPTVNLADNHGFEFVRYYFNIEEECVLYMDDRDIYVRNDNGDYFGSLTGYCYMKPGRYYLSSINNFGKNGRDIKFGVVELDERDFEIELSKTYATNLNTVYYIENKHYPITGYYRYWFTLEEDSKIIHNEACAIFDENGNMISNTKEIVSLPQGKYYAVYYSNLVQIFLYVGD